MPDNAETPQPTEAGGTYGQTDASPAAERSRYRTEQHYPDPAARPDADASADDPSDAPTLTPGSQLDAGAS